MLDAIIASISSCSRCKTPPGPHWGTSVSCRPSSFAPF